MVNLKLWLSKSSSSHRQLHGDRGLNFQSLVCEPHTLPLGYHACLLSDQVDLSLIAWKTNLSVFILFAVLLEPFWSQCLRLIPKMLPYEGDNFRCKIVTTKASDMSVVESNLSDASSSCIVIFHSCQYNDNPILKNDWYYKKSHQTFLRIFIKTKWQRSFILKCRCLWSFNGIWVQVFEELYSAIRAAKSGLYQMYKSSALIRQQRGNISYLRSTIRSSWFEDK